jgi:hypothetical protein
MKITYSLILGILFFSTFLLIGCASTDMTSEANPEITIHHYGTILAVGYFANLDVRKNAENELCEDIVGDTTTKCIESNSVFFPGETYTAEDTSRKLAALHIDAVLTIRPTGSGTSSAYIPPTTYVTGTAYSYGNTVNASTTSQTFGGFSIHKPWANLEITLFSIADNKIAWYATGQAHGNAHASWDDLAVSAADECVEKLLDDGVLQKHH